MAKESSEYRKLMKLLKSMENEGGIALILSINIVRFEILRDITIKWS